MTRRAHIAVVGSFAVGLTMKTERFPSTGETVCLHGQSHSKAADDDNVGIATHSSLSSKCER